MKTGPGVIVISLYRGSDELRNSPGTVNARRQTF